MTAEKISQFEPFPKPQLDALVPLEIEALDLWRRVTTPEPLIKSGEQLVGSHVSSRDWTVSDVLRNANPRPRVLQLIDAVRDQMRRRDFLNNFAIYPLEPEANLERFIIYKPENGDILQCVVTESDSYNFVYATHDRENNHIIEIVSRSSVQNGDNTNLVERRTWFDVSKIDSNGRPAMRKRHTRYGIHGDDQYSEHHKTETFDSSGLTDSTRKISYIVPLHEGEPTETIIEDEYVLADGSKYYEKSNFELPRELKGGAKIGNIDIGTINPDGVSFPHVIITQFHNSNGAIQVFQVTPTNEQFSPRLAIITHKSDGTADALVVEDRVIWKFEGALRPPDQGVDIIKLLNNACLGLPSGYMWTHIK